MTVTKQSATMSNMSTTTIYNKHTRRWVEDLTTRTFGHLTVLYLDTMMNQWLCLCDCGREVHFTTSELKGGRGSCGYCRDTYGMTKYQQYGGLLTLERVGKGLWLCRCLLCGADIKVLGSQLRAGRKKSCGCARSRGGRAPGWGKNLSIDEQLAKIGRVHYPPQVDKGTHSTLYTCIQENS